MKKPCSALVVMLLAAALAGCAGSGARTASALTVEDSVDYERLWTAAIDTLSTRFEILKTEKAAGVIETDYCIGPFSQTGFAVNAVGEGAGESVVRTVRRRALVKVAAEGDSPLDVVVEKEHMIRVHPDALPSGTFSAGRPDESIVAARTRWVKAGRDGGLEAVILREISERYNAGL